jgi:gamma-tubulin complex component 5
MAQNAKMSALTDELIHSILQFDPATNRQAYKHAKEVAARGLRGHQYARTNQFDVIAHFAGLDEKFRVKNRDDLADALQTRLKKLRGATSKFTPDLLSFLLQLSDRPLENTRVEALELLRPPSLPPALTWDEILDDDPYSDEDIWKDIDYAVESSGDEQKPKRRAKAKSSPPTSFEEEDTHNPEACIEPVDALLVKEIEAVQFWNSVAKEDDAQVEMTELQAVRETLFMLAGLQTSLYHLDTQQDNIRIIPRYALGHAVYGTLEHLLSDFVGTGRTVYRLRQWTKRQSSLPLIQTFEAAVQKRLRLYDCSLARLQKRYLSPSHATAVSLLDLYVEVHIISAPLLRLAQIVSDIEPKLLVNPFSHLEALFEQTTLAQMTLENPTFQYLSEIFFECLQTYLKPIRNWMEAGDLGSNDETFFVFENESGSDSASLWHDRYVLRRGAQGQPRSPSFLQPAVRKIFNTGKSVIFLEELGVHSSRLGDKQREPRLDHQTVCGTADEVPMSPFPELFEIVFDRWLRSKYSQASTVLRGHIFEAGGLTRTLIIFETLYLGKNGAVFEGFANTLFERIDSGRRGWNDRYVLTDLAREIFGIVIPRSDVDNVVVRTSKVKEDGNSVKALNAVSIDYALPWVIQNIIQRSSIPTYQQVFMFLLQVYRTKYLLQRTRPTRTRTHETPTTKLKSKLRHRLIWFTDILRSYLTETAIYFTTQDMYVAMQDAEDIDDMAQTHIKYVADLQIRALLSNDLKLIHEAIIDVLNLGVLLTKTTTDVTAEEDGHTSCNTAKSIRRKSTVPVVVTQNLSDSDGGSRSGSEETPKVTTLLERSPVEVLQMIAREFRRLVLFIIAGLRSVGRVSAEPMWEQIAERLEWKGKREYV